MSPRTCAMKKTATESGEKGPESKRRASEQHRRLPWIHTADDWVEPASATSRAAPKRKTGNRQGAGQGSAVLAPRKTTARQMAIAQKASEKVAKKVVMDIPEGVLNSVEETVAVSVVEDGFDVGTETLTKGAYDGSAADMASTTPVPGATESGAVAMVKRTSSGGTDGVGVDADDRQDRMCIDTV